jgi:hypothetical protein
MYIASTGSIADKLSIGKDLEGRGRGIIVVLSRNSPIGTEENNKTPQSG